MKMGRVEVKIKRYKLIKLSGLFYKGFEIMFGLRPRGEEGEELVLYFYIFKNQITSHTCTILSIGP